MSRRKDHIPLREKLASALAHMMVEVDGKLERAIPHEHARQMTADEVCSLFEFDHNVHEAIGGETRHHNLTPRLLAEHRRKTATVDIPQIAKTKRISKQYEDFQDRMLARVGQDSAGSVATTPSRRTRRLRSRGFQKPPEGHKWSFGRRKE